MVPTNLWWMKEYEVDDVDNSELLHTVHLLSLDGLLFNLLFSP